MSDNQNKASLTIGYMLKNFTWDLILIAVLIINLLLICFDWFFSISDVYSYFCENMPVFFGLYGPIHDNMRVVDLIFVAIYLSDLVAGWCMEVFRRKGNSFDYLISHWYDVLGCIPAGSLVFLRLLRIVSIIVRLHKKRLIKLSQYAFFRKCLQLYNMVLEEVSDRVVLNILGGIKSSVRLGMPITREVIERIVIPHKRQAIDIVLNRVQAIARQEYSLHKDELAGYIASRSRVAVESNRELRLIGGIPVVGAQIRDTIERSVSSTVVSVVDGLVSDVISDDGAGKLRGIAGEVSDLALQDLERDISNMVTDVVVEVVNLIGRIANIKQWKFSELRERMSAERQKDNPDEAVIARLEAEYQDLFVKEIEKSWG